MSFKNVLIFGEVLYDCFPAGEQVLGGAPFNVAWHLQALGDAPLFISSVGTDEMGRQIFEAMSDWGMVTGAVQQDSGRPTGTVSVEFKNNEPHYEIKAGCAYDYIRPPGLSPSQLEGILYHGTLALRNADSKKALLHLSQSRDLAVFLDVNLRPPWWHLEDVHQLMEQARWLKLNEDELRRLGFGAADINGAMLDLKNKFPVECLIVTLGEQGALALDRNGNFETIKPGKISSVVDTVGAGDAFSAMFIHGLVAGWPLRQILCEAQRFAGKIIERRGAIVSDKSVYQSFLVRK